MSLPLNVLIVRSFGAESNRKMAAISERLNLVDATDFMPAPGSLKSTHPPWDVLASSGKPGDIEASGRMRRLHEPAMPGEHIGAHVVGRQHGLRSEAPVVLGCLEDLHGPHAP